ncbi:hypothetical protein ACFVVM_01325 [Nocardia sp. NPDC058176]|uniref:hypothetical protein n=1 Tax=Nocardia sp. NPDC058176 TaxID=3346368 RepID=UPI0036DEA3EB
MSRVVKIVFTALLAALLGLGLSPAASADVLIRDAKVADLYIRDSVPSLDQLEKMYAAFFNPNIGLDPKVEVSYHGEKVRPVLEQLMQYSRTMDFFSIQGRAIGPVNINGDRLSVVGQGVAAGFPLTESTFYLVRDGGLWKMDWKEYCAHVACAGDPKFDY